MRKELLATIELLQKLHQLNHPDDEKISRHLVSSSQNKSYPHHKAAFSSPLNRSRLSYFSWLRRLSPSSQESN